MKYSIIVPVFNRPDEVDELLQSLVGQTLKDFEVVIVEDGSEKPCKDVCDKYAGKIDLKYFMKESDIVEVVSDASTETVLFGEMPVKTNLRVTHSEPGVKGDTATNATKPATLETGVEVRVPLFINEGDLIQVDTRDGSYLSRVKE